MSGSRDPQESTHEEYINTSVSEVRGSLHLLEWQSVGECHDEWSCDDSIRWGIHASRLEIILLSLFLYFFLMYKIGIVGATGAVGIEMIRCLGDFSIPLSELRL